MGYKQATKYPALGKNIKTIRKYFHVSQREFVEKMGREYQVSIQTLSAWEGGKADPRDILLEKIVEVLNELMIPEGLSVTVSEACYMTAVEGPYDYGLGFIYESFENETRARGLDPKEVAKMIRPPYAIEIQKASRIDNIAKIVGYLSYLDREELKIVNNLCKKLAQAKPISADTRSYSIRDDETLEKRQCIASNEDDLDFWSAVYGEVVYEDYYTPDGIFKG